MLLSLVPTAAFAAEPEEEKQVTVTETVDTLDADLADNDELFAGYVQQLMYPSYGVSLFADWGSSTGVLNDSEKEIYTQLKSKIKSVAANGGSTEFTLDVSSLDITWTGEEDGYKTMLDTSKIIDCLLVDCPYDLYWFDKTAGTSWNMSISSTGDTYRFASLTATFKVAQGYQTDNDAAVNASMATTAKAAAANAQAVVEKYEGKSDYEKLEAYKNEICGLVSYNNAAADNQATPYGDPWQIIYVFDGDTSTNVVCEGYAKAFQYLCDLSDFNSAVCYTVTGEMAGGTGAGGHMWNIVTLEDKNYLVDVTNCDGEAGASTVTVGYPDKLFLKAPDAGGNVNSGYTFSNASGIRYTYDTDMIDLYGSDILTLSSTDYTPSVASVTIEETTTSYSDINTALNAVDGRTAAIHLLADAEVTTFSINNPNTDITWYGGDYTLSTSGTDNTVTVLLSQGSFTLESGTIESGSGYAVSVGGGTFAMKGGRLEGATRGLQINGGTASLSDGTIFSNGTYGVNVQAGTFTMSGGTVELSEASSTNGIAALNVSSGSAVITGGTIQAPTGKIGIYVVGTGGGTAQISGGTFSGLQAGSGATVRLSGGTFNSVRGDANMPVGNLLAEGYGYQKTADDTWVTNTTDTYLVGPVRVAQLAVLQEVKVTITGVPEEVVKSSNFFKLNAQAQGSFTPNYNKISWSSSDESVLEIQNHGTEKVDGSLQAFAGIAVKGPGTATITATYKDDTYYGSASVTITVLKEPALSDFTITLPSDAVYDGNACTATVTCSKEDMKYTVLYNGSATAPVNAGTYTVTLQVEKANGYAAATFDLGTFTIAKETPTIKASDLTVTKNTNRPLGASISNSGAMTYQSSNSQIATVDASGTVTGVAEGTATITIYYGGSENYNSVTKNVTITVIGKTLVDVTFTVKGDQTYKPEGYALGDQFNAATTTATGGTITYVYNSTTYTSLSALPTVTDAGTYTVTAVYDSATEHGETQAAFTINKANQTALSITSTGPAIYGVDYTLTTSGGSGTGAVTFEATGISGDAGRATVTGNTLHPNRAGVVEVIATKAGDNNYNPVTSKLVYITIEKANYTGANTATGSAKYGTAGTVDLSGLIVSGGTATLGAVTDDNGILNGAPTLNGNVLSFALKDNADNVGKAAEILVTVTSTNYNTYTITVTVTVNNKLTPVVTVSDITVTYTGSPVPASAIKGTATYNGQTVPGTWSWFGRVPTNVRESDLYPVTFTPNDTDTYTAVTQAVNVTIKKATPTGTPGYTSINTSGKTLADAKLTTGSFTVKGSVAWADDTDTEVKANTSYKWVFTPDDTDNYNTVTGSIELWHRSSSSGGSSSSGNKTETEKNPDGSTTTTVTKPDGTVTETTKNPDGSQEVIETKKDGTVTTTTTDKAGNKTEVVENPDGSSKTTVDNKDGSSSVTKVGEDGKVEAQVKLPAAVVEDADGEAVILPMPEVRASTDRGEAPTVTVDLPRNTSAKVEIPVRRATPGTVAVLVKADGTEEIIKTSITTDNGVTVTLSDGDTVKIVDNSKKFADVPASYWGSDYIDFVTSREIFSGTGANTFDPDLPMNRAMIVTVLAAYDGADTSSSGGAWYEAGQRWAMANGISDGTNMEQNLTREQLALMLWSYAGKPDVRHGLAGYPDTGSVSSWAKQAMAWAVENGLISGVDGALAPQGEATRAQVATILMRFVEKTV